MAISRHVHHTIQTQSFLRFFPYDTKGGSPFPTMILIPYLCLWDHHTWLFKIIKIVLSHSLSPDSIRECLQPSPGPLWNHRLAQKGSLGWEVAKIGYVPEWHYSMPLHKLQEDRLSQSTQCILASVCHQFVHNLLWLPHRGPGKCQWNKGCENTL